MKRTSYILAAVLATLVAGTIGFGLYHEHYFPVTVFAVWLCVEFLLWRNPLLADRFSRDDRRRYPVKRAAEFLTRFNAADAAADRELFEDLTEALLPIELSPHQRRWLESLRAMVELRLLVGEPTGDTRRELRRAFTPGEGDGEDAPLTLRRQLALQEVTEAATLVARLYWNLFDCAKGKFPLLVEASRALYQDLFKSPFEPASEPAVEHLIDAMQRDSGVPYLILNLLRRGEIAHARALAQTLLHEETQVDDELKSSLYWIAEVHGFTRERASLGDIESSLRYLYHVCFTDPERAGFLEIDSRYFSQFTMVNELAREGFLFKEVLIEKVLAVWAEYGTLFDGVFQPVMEAMTGQKSKIYDNLEYWERFWGREHESFAREYLYVVEGNLCFAAGHYEDAAIFYEKALERAPGMRAALLNLPFCHAKQGDRERHERACLAALGEKSLHPAALYVAGDSYLLAGDETRAETYFTALKDIEGWELKVEYYKSTFCYEHGLFEQALKFAEEAYRANPSDVAVRYHLSLCYNAVGEKDKALDMVKKVGTAPAWLNYYRFTLERDSGRHVDASRTLLDLPSDYFQDDPEEWNEAVSFARLRHDLVLLQHLKKSR